MPAAAAGARRLASGHAMPGRLVGASEGGQQITAPRPASAGRRSGRAGSHAEPEAAATGSRGGRRASAGRPAAAVPAVRPVARRGICGRAGGRDASRGSCYGDKYYSYTLLPAGLCLVPSRGSRRGGGSTSVVLLA